MRYCFTFLVIHSTKWRLGCFIYLVFHIVCLHCLFLRSTQHGFFFNFQVSFSQPVPCFFFHLLFLALLLETVLTFFCFSIVPSFPSSICLKSFLFAVSLHYFVSAAFTPSISGSIEFLAYHPKLFSSILIHPSQLLNLLPLISLLRYILSISLLGCSTPCIVINFLVLLSKFLKSSLFHSRIPPSYLITEAVKVLTAIILFVSFNFDFSINLNCHRYYLLNISFITFSLTFLFISFLFSFFLSFQYP